MATTCIRSIDTNPIQPLLAYPACGGMFPAPADLLPWEQDQQQTRSRKLLSLSEAVDRLPARPESWW